MSDTLRIGFVGCGAFATSTIWPCLRYAPIEVAYACARRPERAERNARRFGAEHATTDVSRILNDDSVPAMFVIGPPDMQYQIGLQVLEAGKHLFMEKPPGETLRHALLLQDAAERSGVQCLVALQKRFAIAYRMAREVAARSEFGGVRLCKVNYSHWLQPDWRTQLVWMSVHPLDLVRFFMGDPAEAHVLKRSADDGRNTLVMTALYDSGASAVVNMSANDPHVQEWVELSGANQLISVRNLIEYRHVHEAGDYTVSHRMDEAANSGWNPEFAIPYQQADSMWLQGYAGEVVEFAQAVLEGRPVESSISDSVTAMRYVEAIDAAPDGISRLNLESE
jgi:myo-inositol 2-dehydrogenase / D-chiro-inositol 1-dehydrogenase